MMAKAEEGGKLVHMENLSGTTQPAPFQHHTGRPGVVDLSGDSDDLRDTSLGGFLELLGLSSSLFDLPLHPPPPPPLLTEITVPLPPLSLPAVSSELSNAANIPVTPNSCSISSSRTDAADVDQPRSAITSDAEASADDGEEDEKEKQKQRPSTRSGVEEEKKKGQKRRRGPRFAFVTRSEVDHLDDGYRWRKYGQKPVKNSPFPRSYYRCTSATCGVKKQVERSSTDPAVVVTTYEGRHTHPSPVGRRGDHNYALTTVGGGGVTPLMPPSCISTCSHLLASPQHGQQPQRPPLYGGGLPPPLGFTFIRPDDGVGSGGFRGAQEGVNRSELRWRPMHAPGATGGDALVGDRGLLQDMVPHGVVWNGVLQ